MADSLSHVLVKLVGHESNPDIMLLSIRAMTYLCDVFPRSSTLLIRHDVVASLCQRLMAIEYLDVAEQCLQALEKISKDHSLHCLQAGEIMVVLSYIDFFSTSIQVLDEVYKHGLINGVIHLLNSNSRTTLSQPTYSGLIGLLLKLSFGSVGAFKTLYELDISSLLKDILSNYDLSHSHTMTPSHIINGQCKQVLVELSLV